MGKSILTIHKEIEKQAHAKSPLGQLEKKLRTFYDSMVMKREKLPEHLAKEIYNIREENEKRTMEYIDERLKKDRDAVDEFLMDAMTRELEIINKYNGGL